MIGVSPENVMPDGLANLIMSARQAARQGQGPQGPRPRAFDGGSLACSGASYRRTRRADAENAGRPRDTGAEAQGRGRRLAEDRSARKEVLDRRLSGCLDQLAEHRRLGPAAVVAPRPLVDVTLKPLVGDGDAHVSKNSWLRGERYGSPSGTVAAPQTVLVSPLKGYSPNFRGVH